MTAVVHDTHPRVYAGAAAAGVFPLVFAVSAAAASARIDIIDGQYRFEVAKNLLESHSLQIRDPFLPGASQGIGGRYSPYGISTSVLALPLLVAADSTGALSTERRQFFFSLASPILGA